MPLTFGIFKLRILDYSPDYLGLPATVVSHLEILVKARPGCAHFQTALDYFRGMVRTQSSEVLFYSYFSCEKITQQIQDHVHDDCIVSK